MNQITREKKSQKGEAFVEIRYDHNSQEEGGGASDYQEAGVEEGDHGPEAKSRSQIN